MRFEPLSEDEVKTTLDKLVECGVIAQADSGNYDTGPDPYSSECLPALRRLTERYGNLQGKEAWVLAVVPPMLKMSPLDLEGITKRVNLAVTLTNAKE